MIYYVSAQADQGDGTQEKPFPAIQMAADIAMPGDEVVVLPGIYREAVNPVHAGTPEGRITYRAQEKGTAVITGAERIRSWTDLGGGVWKTVVPIAHTGDVYLDGKSLYEVTSLDGVKQPVRSNVSWDPDFSVYTWYTEQDEAADATVLYANFHGLNPNEENVEISVRITCFYPEAEGIGYITLSGFTIRQAATQWAPPTAYQEGMVGPHWSRGWIIEDCDISESKCSGISLGKYLQKENDNKWLKWKYKDVKSYRKHLEKIAEYLDVTPAYLTEGVDDIINLSTMTTSELRLIQLYRKMSNDAKETLLRTATHFVGIQK